MPTLMPRVFSPGHPMPNFATDNLVHTTDGIRLDPHVFEKVMFRAAEIVLEGWCQDTLARDALGQTVPELDPRAVAWCAVAATWKAATEQDALRAWHQISARVGALA